ncbi:2793_t:CDS:2, partial [Funneliformis geosporum]
MDDFHEGIVFYNCHKFAFLYPGHIFTIWEWRTITRENHYVITEPVLPSDKCFGRIHGRQEPILSLGDSDSSVPKVASTKASEDEHCFKLLHPIIRPLFFTDSREEYVIRLNRTTSGIKPPGFIHLQGKKDKLKVQLRARKSINQLLRTKGGSDETVLLTNQ